MGLFYNIKSAVISWFSDIGYGWAAKSGTQWGIYHTMTFGRK